MNVNNNNNSYNLASGDKELSNDATNVLDSPNERLRKRPWTEEEDLILTNYVKHHGEGNWNAVQGSTGLARCGKSCRFRWTNYLRPNLKKGPFSPEEEMLIMKLHAKYGNKWARIAAHLEGRTDNEIKNYWNTRLKRHQRLAPNPAEIERDSHKFKKNMSTFPDNRDPNLNTQLPMHQSPLNFSTQHSNVMGPYPPLIQNFQNYQQFPNQMQKEMPLLNNGSKIGHNQGQFEPQMGYGMTNFGINSNDMIPNYFPNVNPDQLSSNQLCHDQTSIPKPGRNIMNTTMFHAQQGGNFQNLPNMQVLPSLLQPIGGDSNSNWGNHNSVNMGANDGDMNRLDAGARLPGKWTGPDFIDGDSNNMVMKQEAVGEADVQRTIEEFSKFDQQSDQHGKM